MLFLLALALFPSSNACENSWSPCAAALYRVDYAAPYSEPVDYDAFAVMHAKVQSTRRSAALGFRPTRPLRVGHFPPPKSYGDEAMSGGVRFADDEYRFSLPCPYESERPIGSVFASLLSPRSTSFYWAPAVVLYKLDAKGRLAGFAIDVWSGAISFNGSGLTENVTLELEVHATAWQMRDAVHSGHALGKSNATVRVACLPNPESLTLGDGDDASEFVSDCGKPVGAKLQQIVVTESPSGEPTRHHGAFEVDGDDADKVSVEELSPGLGEIRSKVNLAEFDNATISFNVTYHQPSTNLTASTDVIVRVICLFGDQYDDEPTAPPPEVYTWSWTEQKQSEPHQFEYKTSNQWPNRLT